MSMSKSVLCSRNFLGTNFSVHGCNLGRTLCKQTPEKPKETSEKPKRSPLLWDYPEYPDYPTPVRRNWQNKNPTEEQFRYMNARKQELENAKSFEEIPKLPMIPFFGSSWVYFPGIGRYNSNDMTEADLHKQRTYGDIVREKFGSFEVVSSYHPMTNRVLQVHEGRFPARAEFTSLKAYRESRREWYQPLGLVAMQGPEWEIFRLNMMPYVFKHKMYHEMIDNVAGDLVKLIKVKRDDKGEVPDLMELTSRWALESISCIALDTRLGCLDPNIEAESDGMRMIKSVKTQLACMNKLEASSGNFPFFKYFPTPTWIRFVKAADEFTSLVFKYIKSTLDAYMQNKDEAKETTILQRMLMDERLNVPGAMVAVADLIMAGIDTTAHTAGYLIYNLARNPDKQEKLYQTLKSWDEVKKSEEAMEMTPTYYEFCLEESLRLTPAVRGNLRIFDRDVVVHGYRVPAGIAVICVQQVFARDERFFENPNDFIPERYDGKGTFKLFRPFGIGRRSCIGQVLARKEIYTLLQQVLLKYRMEYHYEEIKLKTRLINVPDRAVKVKFIER